MKNPFIDLWLESQSSSRPNVTLLSERAGGRAAVDQTIKQVVLEHHLGANALAELDFKESAATIINRLPTRKRIRSGDLAEIIATEFVGEKLGYHVPIRRLRYKEDRDVSMRGEDVIGISGATGQPHRMLKVEVKSKASLDRGTAEAACAQLNKHDGRPNPSVLAFIAMRLRDEGRHEEARIFDALQTTKVSIQHVDHLVFTMSGNDPSRYLLEVDGKIAPSARIRQLVGIRVNGHQEFIEYVYESLVGQFS